MPKFTYIWFFLYSFFYVALLLFSSYSLFFHFNHFQLARWNAIHISKFFSTGWIPNSSFQFRNSNSIPKYHCDDSTFISNPKEEKNTIPQFSFILCFSWDLDELMNHLRTFILDWHNVNYWIKLLYLCFQDFTIAVTFKHTQTQQGSNVSLMSCLSILFNNSYKMFFFLWLNIKFKIIPLQYVTCTLLDICIFFWQWRIIYLL